MGNVRTVLLTGATGFLGSHLLQTLINNSYEVVVLLRPTSDTWRIAHLKDQFSSFIVNDNAKDIPDLFKTREIDLIIHTATEYGRDVPVSKILETNVLFPVKLIEEGLKFNLKGFLNTDTFFGKEGNNQSYLSDYTTSKKILEGLLKGFSIKLKVANLRIEHVYGENDSDKKFVTSILKQLINNQTDILLTDGLQKRDFIYVKDVADAYLAVLRNIDQITGYQEFEIGTGNAITVKDFVIKMAQVVQSESTLKFGALAQRPGEIQSSTANIENLNNIGWSSQYSIDGAFSLIVPKEKNRFIS